MCDGGEMVSREGRLEQCGETYLPTVVSSCARCGYTKFEPAIGVHWKADADVAPVSSAGPRRAA